MARPTKDGLDYFSLDCDITENDKIQLIEADAEGERGFGVLIKLLAKIYKEKGYFYPWGEVEQKLFSRRINVDNNFVNVCINSAIRWRFFSPELFEKFGILTSAEIQSRWIKGAKRRKELRMVEEFVLIDVENVQKKENVTISLVSVDKYSQAEGVSVYINPVNVDIYSQSKVKESKVKESKVKDLSLSGEREASENSDNFGQETPVEVEIVEDPAPELVEAGSGEKKLKPKKEKKSDTSGREPSPHQAIVDYYFQKFEEKFGSKPLFEGGKDGKIVKDLVQSFGAEKVRILLDLFFASQDSFIVNSGYTVGAFKSQVNKLLTTGGQKIQGASPAMPTAFASIMDYAGGVQNE